jgi:hypothetical protein
MANDVLIYNTTGLTATITLSSLVTLTTSASNCWQGTVLDFGATRAEKWLARLQAAFIAAPTAGGTLDVYMAWSSASASLAPNFPGGATGVNGNYPSPDAIPANGLAQLDFIGSLVACATGSIVAQIQNIGVFRAKEQYGVPVVAMRTSQVLSSVSASHSLMFLDIRDQIQ